MHLHIERRLTLPHIKEPDICPPKNIGRHGLFQYATSRKPGKVPVRKRFSKHLPGCERLRVIIKGARYVHSHKNFSSTSQTYLTCAPHFPRRCSLYFWC